MVALSSYERFHNVFTVGVTAVSMEDFSRGSPAPTLNTSEYRVTDQIMKSLGRIHLLFQKQ